MCNFTVSTMVSSGLVNFLVPSVFLITMTSLNSGAELKNMTKNPTSQSEALIDAASSRRGTLGTNILDLLVTLDVDENSVYLSWDEPIRGLDVNWTYGVFYGEDVQEANTREPRLTTNDLHAVIDDLEFCTRYVFAVRVMDGTDWFGSAQNDGSPRDFRSITTNIDERSSPENLQVDYDRGEHPCLLIKWSGSCPNILKPLGYLITVTERNPSRVTIITELPTKSPELSHCIRVSYGQSYEVKVSTDVSGSISTPTVTYKVPFFLQPYAVWFGYQDGRFLLAWKEPYVPPHVGPYFYEIYAYPGRNLTSRYETYGVSHGCFAFKGNASEYTCMIGLKSYDGLYKSPLTIPIVKATDRRAEILEVH